VSSGQFYAVIALPSRITLCTYRIGIEIVQSTQPLYAVCVLLSVLFNGRVKNNYFKNGSPNKVSLFVMI
jgi:hypothetical protein